MKSRISLIAITIFFLFSHFVLAQQNDRVSVKGSEDTFLTYPWAGGMNAVQFGNIDLNMDGLYDLVVFDRHGDRKLCFVNDGVYNKVSYTFSPQFADQLPELSDWAVFVDYDGDGRTDIFTFFPFYACMKVYRNVSEETLKFELVADQLKTFQENNYVNLYISDVDYPGIADIDGDGDLDIVSFYLLGTYVNYHRNMSMENYGTADSLDYRLEEYCWGNFGESDASNTIYLDTCFQKQPVIGKGNYPLRHSGSTFLMLDLNKDTLMDLLLGDIDYPGLYALYNDGNKYNAHIGSYDTIFPATTEKIELYSFPAAAYIDVNNDGKNDLLVSPFESRLNLTQNKHSVWYYRNSGSNNKPFFTLVSKDFLQSEMIDRGSGAYPVLFDWNKDGLMDLFVGNYGFFNHAFYDSTRRLHCIYYSRIAYYQNTGTAQLPQFQLMDDDFGGLSTLKKTGFMPAFTDLDGDGDMDFLTGYDGGRLISVINEGNHVTIADTNYMNIDVGSFSKPQLFDLNKDGLPDLIVGKEDGKLSYYENTGTALNPQFNLVTNKLGSVDVTNYDLSYTGYSVPWFFRDTLGTTHLVVGSEDGLIFYFTNIDDNLNGDFTESDNLEILLDTSFVSFDRGTRTAAAIADINDDGKFEMLAGNYSGGLEYFGNRPDVSPGFDDHIVKGNKKLLVFPNPAQNVVHIQTDSKWGINALIKITDINGKIVFSGKTSGEKDQRIDVSGFRNGIYFVRLIDNNQIYTGKLIINKKSPN